MLTRLRSFFARRRTKSMFGEHVSPEWIERMVNSGKDPELGGHEEEISPFVANMQGYVGLAEQLSLAQLRELMNAYFTACTDPIQRQGGMLDKYVGDAVVAMFGAPIPLPDHPLRACLAALECQSAVAALRQRFQNEGEKWPSLARQVRVRIGINSGIATIGNMGSRTRFNYTMMGDNVNLAARLEAAAKSYGVWTLCSESTRRGCEGARPGAILFRSLGRIIVKGRAHPLELFEPLVRSEDVTDAMRECVHHFEAGLQSCRERNWLAAAESFTRSSHLERDQPSDAEGIRTNPSLVLLAELESARANPNSLGIFLNFV